MRIRDKFPCAHFSMLRFLTLLHMLLLLRVSTSLLNAIFPRNASGVNLSFGYGCLRRLTELDECFLVIVSVTRYCRVFSSVSLCEKPKTLVPQA